MKISNPQQSTCVLEPRASKPYSAPGLKRVAPDAARKMLLRRAEANDPEVEFMLDCIERLRDLKGS